MLHNYYDPNDYINVSDSDSRMIQRAVDEAARSGCGSVVIPSFNQRTGTYLWEIEETILLPSHITVTLDNAHLRMADGVFCQMFRNANAFEEIGRTPEGMQEDIVLRGVGRAILDGGKHNGLREKTSLQDGMPHIVNNLTVYLHNVRNFRIEHLTVRDQRWWGITLAWAWDGVISDIHFEIGDKSIRESAFHPWRNQDGIDLRVGCHDIQILNLTGETCDDIVALTALAIRPNCFELQHACDHLSFDIYNVTIQNITGRNNHCALIRLLCHNRRRIHDITIDGITDATPENEDLIRTASCVKIGENGYCPDPSQRCRPEEMRDIFISNVHSAALAGVVLNCAAQNVIIRNLSVSERGNHAIAVSQIKAGRHLKVEVSGDELDTRLIADPTQRTTTVENLLADGIFWNSTRREGVPFYFDGLIARNFRVRNAAIRGDVGLIRELNPREENEDIVFENVTRF